MILNPIISHILAGNNDKAINNFKKNLSRLFRMKPDNYLLSDFHNLYSTIKFVMNFDPFVKSIMNKRMTQITSYEYTLEGDKTITSFIDSNIDVFYNILYNTIIFGKCLVRIVQKIYGFEIEIIEPYRYYTNDDDIIFLDDSEYTMDSLIFFGGELIDISSIGIPLVIQSLTMQNCDKLWYNNNIKLNGFIHSTISPDAQQATQASDPNFHIADKITEDIENLSDTGGVLSTPLGVEIQHKSIVNDSVGNSYKLYISEKKENIEIIILGQAGTTREGNKGSYAKTKIMAEAAREIEYSDVKSLQNIVSDIITWFRVVLNSKEQTTFKINIAVDQDEKYLVDVLNSLKQLNLKDEFNEPLSISSEWLKTQINIPFNNTGDLVIGEHTPRGNLEENNG